MKHRVSELEGALLDAAVAECGEWKTAHGHFQTMTLDPTFKGWRLIRFRSELVCLLEPNNPMRQDPKLYNPSTDWALGGPIIERERICICPPGMMESGLWEAFIGSRIGKRQSGAPDIVGDADGFGSSALQAAMRAFVAAKLGPEVELPEAP